MVLKQHILTSIVRLQVSLYRIGVSGKPQEYQYNNNNNNNNNNNIIIQ